MIYPFTWLLIVPISVADGAGLRSSKLSLAHLVKFVFEQVILPLVIEVAVAKSYVSVLDFLNIGSVRSAVFWVRSRRCMQSGDLYRG